MSESMSSNLRAYSLFQGLGDDELELVARLVRTREVDSGTVILAENETGGDLYLLDDGVVDISKTLTIVTAPREFGTRDRSFVRLTGADHCVFGEMALVGNRERSATVRAVTRCRLLVIRDTDFLALCESRPRVGFMVMNNIAVMLSEHLRRANTDILKLTTALSLALSG